MKARVTGSAREAYPGTSQWPLDDRQSSGGVPGLWVGLCARVILSPSLQIKLDGASTIANVE